MGIRAIEGAALRSARGPNLTIRHDLACPRTRRPAYGSFMGMDDKEDEREPSRVMDPPPAERTFLGAFDGWTPPKLEPPRSGDPVKRILAKVVKPRLRNER